MTKLFIVESPGKVKKIGQYLGGGWRVKASIGHIRDLPEKEIGVEAPDFKPKYIIMPTKTKVVAELKSAVQQVDAIYLGTDPDREGEAIAWHLYVALGLKKLGKPVYRVTFNEINQVAIQTAVAQAGKINAGLVSAQEARRVLDRLVGYLVSPVLGFGLSAGRVQSPALRLVVEREAAIINFKPLTHYQVEASVTEPFIWKAQWNFLPFLAKDETYWLDKTIADAVAQVTQLKILQAKPSAARRKPPAPFTTSTLQQAASAYLGFSPEHVMKMAQNLYEMGAISYHRTDNPNLSDESIKAIRQYLQAAGQPISPKPNTWKAKDNAQEAHEAIRPVALGTKKPSQNENENKLYALIWRRAVASQMPDAVYDVLTIKAEGNVAVPLKHHPLAEFTVKGRVLKEKGWLAIAQEHENETGEEADQVLPPIKVGEIYVCTGNTLEKQTQPPKRYTEAGLIKKLEDLGIGRPSTYASILANLKRREYVSIEKKTLRPTDKGTQIIQRLLAAKFSFLDYDYTQQMEAGLDKVAAQQSQYIDIVRDGHGVLAQELQLLGSVPNAFSNRGQHPSPSDSASAEAIGQCACGGAIIDKAKLWGCHTCNAAVWKTSFGRKIKRAEALALLKGETITLNDLLSKAKKKYSAEAKIENGKVKLQFAPMDNPPLNVPITE